MSEHTTILGWDAAWTETGSGAWSILRCGKGKPEVLMVESTPKEWAPLKSRLDQLMTQYVPELVTLDMPVGKTPVRGYREADRATTKAFSAYGCPVHSPTPERPGRWGDQLMEALGQHGFNVATQTPVPKMALVEVYPHTALLKMLRLSYRFPYKIGRAGTYWSEITAEEGRSLVRKNLKRLRRRLGHELDLSRVILPFPPERPITRCKEYEDQLDSLVCVWIGWQILKGTFSPYGDQDAAIWNPNLISLDPPDREF